MTTRDNLPQQFREKLSQLIRYEMQGMPTASLARIKSLDEETRRATVETVPDGTTESNVPVASPFATDGAGDLAPINPELHDHPVRGVVLYLHHPLEPQLTSGGFEFDGRRESDEENAIFLPAMLWFDDDTVPDHEAGERRIENPEGNAVRMDEETAGVEHSLGAFAHTMGNPAPATTEGIEGFKTERDEDEDFATIEDGQYVTDEEDLPDELVDWPEGADGESWFEAGHVDGRADVATTRRGTAFNQGGGAELATAPHNDGERKTLDGPHQHFHVKQNADGTADLVGPQLSFREFIAWMTDSNRQSTLNNADQYSDARTYAENYLAWLEDTVGRTIDPTNPDDWPDPQPMPTPSENAGFSPSVTHDPGTDIQLRPAVAQVGATAHEPAIITEQN